MNKSLAFIIAALTLGVVPMAFAGGPMEQSQFVLNGLGNVTNPGQPGCQFTPQGCTIAESGSFSSNEGNGNWVASLHIDWAHATSNGQGGYCAPTDGSSTLSFTGDGTLLTAVSGQVCEVGPTATGAPHFLAGTFDVISGTGAFAGTTGSGAFSGADNGAGAVRSYMNGFLERACYRKDC